MELLLLPLLVLMLLLLLLPLLLWLPWPALLRLAALLLVLRGSLAFPGQVSD